MRPSSRFSYALRALVDLAIHQATGPVTVRAIAKRQGIPLRYLEQLFNRLRREGIVMAERGPRGGYTLSKSPNEIPVSLIFQSMELKVPSTKSTPARHPESPVPPDPSSTIWKQVEEAIQRTLKSTTLQALVAHSLEHVSSPLNHRFTFHI